MATLAYNARQGFPFSTYGETALIALQNLVICVLVLRYRGRGAEAGGVLAGLAAVLWGLMDERVVGREALGYVQAVAGNLAVASKMPQIWTVWRQGGTGQLSAFAVSFLFFFGFFFFEDFYLSIVCVLYFGGKSGLMKGGGFSRCLIIYWDRWRGFLRRCRRWTIS